MLTDEQRTVFANEARRNELRQKIAGLQGGMNATASAVQRLNSMNSDGQRMLQLAQSELAALEAGAGPGITQDFGQKSVVTQLVESERFAGKAACIDYVKTHPGCTEDEAAAAWNEAALASHPDFPLIIQDGKVMSALYRSNMLKDRILQEDSWEAQRQFIVLTNKEAMMSM